MFVRRVLAGMILLGPIFAAQDVLHAPAPTSKFNMQAQAACEAEMLGNMGGHEAFSGKTYDVLVEVARALS